MTPNPPATDRHREAALEIYRRFIEWKEFNPDNDNRLIELLARYFPGGEEPGWISASERLPNIGTYVLVLKVLGGCEVVEYSKRSAEHIRIIRRDGQWWDNGKQITHWQPLPASPQPSGEDK